MKHEVLGEIKYLNVLIGKVDICTGEVDGSYVDARQLCNVTENLRMRAVKVHAEEHLR